MFFYVFESSTISIRLKIQTKSSHKIHRSELLRPDFVNLNSWIAINEFIFDYKIKHYTPPTIKSLYNTNALMIKWIGESYGIIEIKEVKTVYLKGYIFSKIENNLKETYINGIIKSIRAFFKYAIDNEL